MYLLASHIKIYVLATLQKTFETVFRLILATTPIYWNSKCMQKVPYNKHSILTSILNMLQRFELKLRKCTQFETKDKHSLQLEDSGSNS
jgi:hypothetical protein